MLCREVMTENPVCCLPQDLVSVSARAMRREDVGAVPVINDEQRRQLIGIVTDRDLCMTVVAAGRDPRSVTVAECMTPKVVSCSPDDAVEKVTELMRENQIRRVPVVNEGGALQGIVALADIVERSNVKSTQTHETLKEVSAPTDVPSKPRAESKPAA